MPRIVEVDRSEYVVCPRCGDTTYLTDVYINEDEQGLYAECLNCGTAVELEEGAVTRVLRGIGRAASEYGGLARQELGAKIRKHGPTAVSAVGRGVSAVVRGTGRAVSSVVGGAGRAVVSGVKAVVDKNREQREVHRELKNDPELQQLRAKQKSASLEVKEKMLASHAAKRGAASGTDPAAERERLAKESEQARARRAEADVAIEKKHAEITGNVRARRAEAKKKKEAPPSGSDGGGLYTSGG